MITRIYADNFQCLGNFEFRPKELNLLLGKNGSGNATASTSCGDFYPRDSLSSPCR